MSLKTGAASISQKITDNMQTTKDFYRNASGPIERPLRSLDAYELNTHRNAELEAMSDSLILYQE